MPSLFYGMQHLNENLMCSIGISTSGPDPDVHELLEIAVLPANHMLNPHDHIMLFNMRLPPSDWDSIDWSKCDLSRKVLAELITTGVPRDKIADLFLQWYQNLGLKEHKRIIPLGYDYHVQRQFIYNWLGPTTFYEIFGDDYRDVHVVGHYINDRHDVRGMKLPFAHQNLRWIADQLGVENPIKGRSANAEALMVLETYKRLLKTFQA